MELKEFIVNALTDITDAIKDCQQNVANGAIFAPTNTKANNKIKTPNGELPISEIGFDVAVTVSSENIDGVSGGGGIAVLGVALGAKGKAENKVVEATVSHIKFSVPIIYPPHQVSVKPPGVGLL